MPSPENPIRILRQVPDDVFAAAKTEVLKIDWHHLPVADTRSKTSVFRTSISNHLRLHKKAFDAPDTREANGKIIECIDTRARGLYPSVDKLVMWAYRELKGFHLGRIMIVKLEAGGIIGSHVDAGAYFEYHYRLHIPIVTFPEVLFTGPVGSSALHMPAGHLVQLLNQNLHGAMNGSNFDRIHLIVDIASNADQLSYSKLDDESQKT